MRHATLAFVLLAAAASAQDRPVTQAEIDRQMEAARRAQAEALEEQRAGLEVLAAELARDAAFLRERLARRGLSGAEVDHHVACYQATHPAAMMAAAMGQAPSPRPDGPCELDQLALVAEVLEARAADAAVDAEADLAAATAAAPVFTSVAIDARGRWVVGSTHRAAGRPRLATAPGLSETLVNTLGDLDGAALVALGPGSYLAASEASGAADVYRYGGTTRCDYPYHYRQRGAPAVPFRVVLDPAGCDWLMDDGREVWASAAWAPVAQRMAGADPRPVALAVPGHGLVLFAPDGRVVGGSPPEPLAAFVREAHATTGDLQSVAVDATGRGPEGRSGIVVVGERGYRARFVDPALCEALEAVTGVAGGEAACERNPDAVRAERLAETLPPIPWPDALPREAAEPLDG